MAEDPPVTYELIFSESNWTKLQSHLFPGDGDEHGAVIAAGVARSGSRVRLLARHLFLAKDGVDYVPGRRGYRMPTGEFVRDCALFCRDEELAYLAVHNHRGRDYVRFSTDDMQSHERGYPALRDIVCGQIVGGIVFAENAVAGDLWLSDSRAELNCARIVGRNIQVFYPNPQRSTGRTSPTFDRQARAFGDRGQELLRVQRIGIIGLGGVGSILCEYLARLGVGNLVLVDPDRLDITNISRVVGSTESDARADPAEYKVSIAKREALRGNPSIQISTYPCSVVDQNAAEAIASCDYIFLAADSMQARLLFNSVVHQYLVPGTQLGSKIMIGRSSGDVGQVFSVIRPVNPGHGCLWCNGLINTAGLQSEAISAEERRAQRYVDEEDVVAPSVITLNAVAASFAVNNYLFSLLGLRDLATQDDYVYIEPTSGSVRVDEPRADHACTECSATRAGRFARGDSRVLPVRSC
jgi:molybdopterin/thiamine biosynthesis adenylyltransferase